MLTDFRTVVGSLKFIVDYPREQSAGEREAQSLRQRHVRSRDGGSLANCAVDRHPVDRWYKFKLFCFLRLDKGILEI